MNALIGNGDAHGKNFSLLHQPSGALTLAPLYDLLSTLHYGDDRLAMYVDNVHRTNKVTAERIVNEATAWGLSRNNATAIVDDLLARAPDAMAAARDETEGVSKELFATVNDQLARLRSKE